MKKKIYQVLPLREQHKLSQLFPEIEKFHYHGKRLSIAYGDTEELLKKNNYQWFYITVYDHDLDSNNEADKQDLEVFFKYDDSNHPKSPLLSAFNLELFQNTTLLNYRPMGKKDLSEWYGRHEKVSFRKFLSFEKFKLANKNYLFPYLVLPELKALYFPGSGLRHLLIYRDENLLQDFKKWVANANLFILRNSDDV